LMRKTFTLVLTLMAGGVILSPFARGSSSYSESFSVEALIDSVNGTFSTSAFAPFNQSLGTLNAVMISLSGDFDLDPAVVGEEVVIKVEGTSIMGNFVDENETPGVWDFPVSFGGTDSLASDIGFYSSFKVPIETELTITDTNLNDEFDISPASSLTGVWTWEYTATPEPGSLLLCLAGLAGLLGWKKR
jgi:hypothetical protein